MELSIAIAINLFKMMSPNPVQLDGLGSPDMEPFAVCPGGGNDPEASWVVRMYHVVSRLSIDLSTVGVSLTREITSGRKSSI